MDPMPESEQTRFDFGANAWVRDDFLTRRTVEIAAPEVPPAEGRWVVAPERQVRSRGSRIAVAIALMLLVDGFLYHGLSGLFWAFVWDTVGLLVWSNLAPTGPAGAGPDDLRLFETSDDPDVCLVEVTIVHDDHEVGTDRGVAWFEDGALLFSGAKTSFAIGGQDVLPRSFWGEYGRECATALPRDAIPLRTTRPRTYLRIVPLDRNEKVAAEQTARLLRERQTFRERPTLSPLSRQWPPFRS